MWRTCVRGIAMSRCRGEDSKRRLGQAAATSWEKETWGDAREQQPFLRKSSAVENWGQWISTCAPLSTSGGEPDPMIDGRHRCQPVGEENLHYIPKGSCMVYQFAWENAHVERGGLLLFLFFLWILSLIFARRNYKSVHSYVRTQIGVRYLPRAYAPPGLSVARTAQAMVSMFPGAFVLLLEAEILSSKTNLF